MCRRTTTPEGLHDRRVPNCQAGVHLRLLRSRVAGGSGALGRALVVLHAGGPLLVGCLAGRPTPVSWQASGGAATSTSSLSATTSSTAREGLPRGSASRLRRLTLPRGTHPRPEPDLSPAEVPQVGAGCRRRGRGRPCPRSFFAVSIASTIAGLPSATNSAALIVTAGRRTTVPSSNSSTRYRRSVRRPIFAKLARRRSSSRSSLVMRSV